MALETITLRLTHDNVETMLKPGDVFPEDREFGAVTQVWAITAGAKVWTTEGVDTLGLPSTVTVERHV